jgi:hypothetical protein
VKHCLQVQESASGSAYSIQTVPIRRVKSESIPAQAFGAYVLAQAFDALAPYHMYKDHQVCQNCNPGRCIDKS